MAGWEADGAKQGVDDVELSANATQGMPGAEEIVCPHQGVPLIVQQADQLIELPAGKSIQTRAGQGPRCPGGYLP